MKFRIKEITGTLGEKAFKAQVKRDFWSGWEGLSWHIDPNVVLFDQEKNYPEVGVNDYCYHPTIEKANELIEAFKTFKSQAKTEYHYL